MNANLLNQLANPQPVKTASISNMVAGGQQLQQGQLKLEQARMQLDSMNSDQEKQERISRILQNSGSIGEMGKRVLGEDPRLGATLINAQTGMDNTEAARKAAEIELSAKREREIQLHQVVSGILAQESYTPEQEAVILTDPEGYLKAYQKDMMASEKGVNSIIKEDASGNLIAIHPRTHEVTQLGVKGKKTGQNITYTSPDGSTFSIGQGGARAAEGNIAAPRQTTRDVIEKNLADDKMLTDLASVADDHIGGFFGSQTAAGKMLTAGANLLSSIGVDQKDVNERIAKTRRFKEGIQQVFNAYRKEITGAAAAVQELEALKESILHADLNPAQLTASYNSLIAKIVRGKKIAQQLLAEGYSLDSDKAAYESAFDVAYSAGVFGESQSIDYLTLFKNMHAGAVNEVEGIQYASDGEKWIKVRGGQ